MGGQVIAAYVDCDGIPSAGARSPLPARVDTIKEALGLGRKRDDVEPSGRRLLPPVLFAHRMFSTDQQAWLAWTVLNRTE